MSKKERGPWNVRESAVGALWISGDQGMPICFMRAGRPGARGEARLIAAAPNLLECLKTMVDLTVTEDGACVSCMADADDHLIGCPVGGTVEMMRRLEPQADEVAP